MTTDIPDLLIFEPAVYKDERGYFFESYNEQIFHKEGYRQPVCPGQPILFPPMASSAASTISSIRMPRPSSSGSSRAGYSTSPSTSATASPTYGKYVGVELSADNKRQLLIPRGFAHGFSVLSETATVSYKCDALYHKESEGGIRYDDPQLNIDWQIPAGKAIVSAKDLDLPLFAECRNNF